MGDAQLGEPGLRVPGRATSLDSGGPHNPRNTQYSVPSAPRGGRRRTQEQRCAGSRGSGSARARPTQSPAPPRRSPPRARTPRRSAVLVGLPQSGTPAREPDARREEGSLARGTCAGTAAHFSTFTSGVRCRSRRTFPWASPWRAGCRGLCGPGPSELAGGAGARPHPTCWLRRPMRAWPGDVMPQLDPGDEVRGHPSGNQRKPTREGSRSFH